MRVVGIDAGYVNFAICGVTTDRVLKPYFWKKEALFEGEFSEERLCHAIYEWIQKPEIVQLLDEADVIVLERQMSMKFQAVNHCIRFRYFEKTREVHPNTVGKYFGLPLDRKGKKKKAVDLVQANTILPIKKGKKDDLCDAYLLALFLIFQKFPALREGWTEDERNGNERKRANVSKKPQQKDAGPAAKKARPVGTTIKQGIFFDFT